MYILIIFLTFYSNLLLIYIVHEYKHLHYLFSSFFNLLSINLQQINRQAKFMFLFQLNLMTNLNFCAFYLLLVLLQSKILED